MGLNTCPLLSFLKQQHVDNDFDADDGGDDQHVDDDVDADDGGDDQHVDHNAGVVDVDDEI